MRIPSGLDELVHPPEKDTNDLINEISAGVFHAEVGESFQA